MRTERSSERRGSLRLLARLSWHRGKIFLIIAVTMATTAAYVLLRAEEYVAFAEIVIARGDGRFEDLVAQPSTRSRLPRPEELELEVRRISSASSIAGMIGRTEPAPQEARLERAKASSSALAENPDAFSVGRLPSEQLADFRERLVVQRDPVAPIIRIGYRSADAEFSATMANKVAEAYLDMRAADQRQKLKAVIADLERSSSDIPARLEGLRAREAIDANSSAWVIEPATLPTRPANTDGWLLTGLALAGSCVASAGLALLNGAPPRRFDAAGDVEGELGRPVLGVLPRINGLVTSDHDLETSPSARQWSLEAYGFVEGIRQILNTVLPSQYRDVSGRGKVLLVTSSLPDEGKTTFALSLVRQAALSGASALFVEGDLRKPGLAARLKTVSAEHGLADVLRGKIENVDQSLVTEKEGRADLLLAHGPHDDAFVLARSPRLKRLIDDLASRYDLVVIDCPPVLGVSDTRALSDLADQILFAVQYRETPQALAKSAMRQLDRDDLPVSGVVLTQVDLADHVEKQGITKKRYRKSYEAYA